MRKFLLSLLSAAIIFSGSANIYAKETNQDVPPLQYSDTQPVEKVSEFLDSLDNTQVLVASEKDIIEKMLQEKTISNEDLNQELLNLSKLSPTKLYEKGYDSEQIKIIKEYDSDVNAFDYLYSSENARATDATVRFRYGLAGKGSRKELTIAYDIRWSENPFFTFTDSFGIGWIAADENSYELVMKTDYAEGTVQYYDTNGNYANLYRDIEIDTSENGVAVGTPILGSAQGNYGKVMGGVIEVSTQFGSSNIEIIHLFVTYAHTLFSVSFNWEAALDWEKMSGSISFIPSVNTEQKIMAEGNHTFRYNSQDVIVADIK